MVKSAARARTRAAGIPSGARPWYPSDFTAEERQALDRMLAKHIPDWRIDEITGTGRARRPEPRLVPDHSKEHAARIAYAFDQQDGFGALACFDCDEPAAKIKRARTRLICALRAFHPVDLADLLHAFEPETREEPSARAARRQEVEWRAKSEPLLAEWAAYFRARAFACRAIADSLAISEAQRVRLGGVVPTGGIFGYAARELSEDRDDAAAVIAALDGRLARLAKRIALADELGSPRPLEFWRWRRRGASFRREAVGILNVGLAQLGFSLRDIAALVLESSTWMVPQCPMYIAAKAQGDGDPKERIAWEIGKDLRRAGTNRVTRAR